MEGEGERCFAQEVFVVVALGGARWMRLRKKGLVRR